MRKKTLYLIVPTLALLLATAGTTALRGQEPAVDYPLAESVTPAEQLPYLADLLPPAEPATAVAEDSVAVVAKAAAEDTKETVVTAPKQPLADDRVLADRSGRVAAQAAPAEPASEAVQGPQQAEPQTTAPAATSKQPEAAAEPAQRSLTYTNYTVKSGDTLWNIANSQGVPLPELLRTNGLSEQSALSVGMVLQIPRHQIPQKATPGPEFGELLDWWTEAQYVWPIGRDARIIDFRTGKSFMARRTYGAFHADVEPLTAADTQIMREIWGGWSWSTRPVIVEVDGRRLAASANGMPHSIQTITNNGFDGHFCIHFLNSTRHADNLVQADHQRNVRTAAGR